MVNQRRRVLLVQPDMSRPNGAVAVAAWIIEALKAEYDVAVLTAVPVDWRIVNRSFGTSINSSEVKVIVLNVFLRAIFRLDPDPQSIQPVAYLMRVCRRIRSRFDLVVSAAMEEADLGGPGLLYVHFPSLGPFWRSQPDVAGLSSFSQILALVQRRLRPWVFLAGYSVDRMKQCRIVTNSGWTQDLLREYYDIDSTIIYPPVTSARETLPWSERKNAFVTIGSFHRGKRFNWIIDLVERLRRSHSDLELHIIGSRATGKTGRRYYSRLMTRAQEHSQWLSVHEAVSRSEMQDILGRSRYAIHALRGEHFGIAPAEALLAGCIPFVHDSGGQVEIVGRDSRLCFTSADDAVEKIDSVLNDAALQYSLGESLVGRRSLFGTERFKTELCAAVRLSMYQP